MPPNAARVLTVIFCGLTAYCKGDITAYVKEHLTSTLCVSVPRVRDVCNIGWKLREADAEIYNEIIEQINATISSSEIYHGLTPFEAGHCRKMYENMICRSSFPVCDPKRLVIDYGNATALCEFARDACRTISIQGCEYNTNGVESITSQLTKCMTISANTSKLCPGTQLKVPNAYNLRYAKPMVERLSKIAAKFTKELNKFTITARCEMKYREVLCRMLDTCSPDEFYYLQYINKSECEAMIACVRSAGFSAAITSICSEIPQVEESKTVTVANPYTVHYETERPATTWPPTTVYEKTWPPTTVYEKTWPPTTVYEKTSDSTTDEGSINDFVTEPTFEILLQPTHENSKTMNNSIPTKVSNVRGSASKNFKPFYFYAIFFAFFLGRGALCFL